MVRTNARRTVEVTELEKQNAKIARKAAIEGIVLLKNDGSLPIKPGAIALYGEGATNTVKGGTGSGEVNARHVVSIREGLEQAGYDIKTTKWLDDYDRDLKESKEKYITDMRKRSGFMNFRCVPYLVSHPFNNPTGRSIRQEDIAVGVDTCFYVLSRQAGENVDRRPEKGDLCLTDIEVSNIRLCTQNYKNTIIVINVGGMMDLSPLDDMEIQGIVFFCQQGGEGGHAFADLVSGKAAPSGHLTFSWPMKYSDIPFADEFSHLNGNTLQEDYREGICVGYRYFDSFNVTPRYEFGFGLSYTEFSMESTVKLNGDSVAIKTTVANIGEFTGKAVVQVYASCPAGKLDKEYQRLVGFAKTDALQPGEAQDIDVSFDLSALASYNADTCQTLLEKGDYTIRIGESSRKAKPTVCLRLAQDAILYQHETVCPMNTKFEELHSAKDPQEVHSMPTLEIAPGAFQTIRHEYSDYPACRGSESDKVMASLDDAQRVDLCIGSGLDVALPKPHFFIVPGACGCSTAKLEKHGVPSIAFCDGPSGLRLFDVSVIKGKTVRMVNAVMAFMNVLPTVARRLMFGNPKKGQVLYQYATAFPVGLSMAQTWNTKLLTEIGHAIQAEMEAFGAVYWLGPGMNIHRNPLCGRNYEYYSEDPLLTGKLAAAITRGVQHKAGYFATVKHFAANNQETDRRLVSENVSERALREIYLRGFEIAVKEGEPRALMTSYNRINGVYAAENFDLCTKVLRNEWGFKGLVMTDWTTENNLLNSAKSMQAGVNLMMPGIKSDYKQIRQALKDDTLQQSVIDRNASYVLQGIVESDIYRVFKQEHRPEGENSNRFSLRSRRGK